MENDRKGRKMLLRGDVCKRLKKKEIAKEGKR